VSAVITSYPLRPGEWFLHWTVLDLDAPDPDGKVRHPWCPWRRWVWLTALEGSIAVRPPARLLRSRGSEYDSDPTPYPSAEAAVAASALLGLETGARLSLFATAHPLPDALGHEHATELPTPAHSAAAVEELVLLHVGRAPLPSRSSQDHTNSVVAALRGMSRAPTGEVRAAVDRLLADGRLVHDTAWIGWDGDLQHPKARECTVLRVTEPSGHATPHETAGHAP